VSRLASLRVAPSEARAVVCSLCGKRSAVTTKDPVCSAASLDDTMRRLKLPFLGRVGQWGVYHVDCAAELGRERKRLDAEKRERTRAKRSAAARRRFHGAQG